MRPSSPESVTRPSRATEELLVLDLGTGHQLEMVTELLSLRSVGMFPSKSVRLCPVSPADQSPRRSAGLVLCISETNLHDDIL